MCQRESFKLNRTSELTLVEISRAVTHWSGEGGKSRNGCIPS